MTAHHFFVSSLANVIPGDAVALSQDDSHHAFRSLRLRVGEDLSMADGSGRLARGRLHGERAGAALVEVLEIELRPQPSPSVVVAMAPPKGDRLAWAVQKLAEIGVDDLLLLTDAERSVRRGGEGSERADARTERLRRIAREAAMQSRRPFVMSVGAASLQDAIGSLEEGGTTLLLWEGATELLNGALADRDHAPGPLRLVVGPEGSFSENEIDLAAASGAVVVSLGPGILRTETAAIAAAVLVLGNVGRLG